MAHLYVKNGRTGYVQVVQHVLKHGRERSPRGLKTLDAGFVTVTLESPLNALPVGCGRNVSSIIAALEAIQLIGGFSGPELMPSEFDKFKNADGSFHGAYGPRVRDQLKHAVTKLVLDHDTRQAVVEIWSGNDDNPPYRGYATVPNDIPCTVAFGFQIVNNMLEMNVVMRSNDVWLGTPYDWFQFTQLQYTVANALRIPAGPYHHTAWSLHIYEEHIEAAQRLRQPPDEDYTRGTSPTGIGCWGESLQTIQDQARRLADHRVVVLQQRVNESEWWYHQQLKAAFLNRKIIDE